LTAGIAYFSNQRLEFCVIYVFKVELPHILNILGRKTSYADEFFLEILG